MCVQLCLPLCDPVDCSPPGSSVHEIFQARILGRVAISSSKGWIFPNQGSNLCLLHWQVDSLRPSHLASPLLLIVVVQSLSRVRLFAIPWTAASQASLFLTISQSLLKLMSTESVMPSNHLVLPLLLLPSNFPSTRLFYNELALHIRWPKYWSFNFSISPSNEYSGLISFRVDWFDLSAVQGTLKSSPAQQFKSINSSVLSFFYAPTLTSVHGYWKSHNFD